VELTGLGIDVAVDLPGEAALGEARAVFADRRAINRCGRRGRRGQQRRRWCGRRGPSGRGDGHRLGPWRLAARLRLDLSAPGSGLALRARLQPARLGTRRFAARLGRRLDRRLGHRRDGRGRRLALLLDLLESLEELAHGVLLGVDGGEPAHRVRSECQQEDDDQHEKRDAGARGPDGGATGNEVDAAPSLPLAALALLEVLDGFLHDAGVDPLLAVGVARQQTVVAHDVDDARRALVVVVDLLNRGVREDTGVGGAGDAQPVADVLPRLFRTQRRDVTTQADPLLELAELRQIELVAQLGLADEQDLHELLIRRLEVGQQAHGLQRLHREVLRLADDAHVARALVVLSYERRV